MTTSKSTVGAIVSISIVVGAIVTILSFWDIYGWITRTSYAQDHEGASVEVQQTAILKSLEAITLTLEVVKQDQAKNQDQWECDETDEELKEILEKEDLGALSASDRRDKEKLKEVWIAKRCTRFTD